MTIPVNYPPHSLLERDVIKYLQSAGFEICTAPYHDTMPSEIVKLLKNRFDLTSLYLRGRADRIAIHKTLPITFEFELKTHSNAKYHDWVIEALPLMHHMSKSQLGVLALYVFRNPYQDCECGFWVNQMPLANRAVYTNRYHEKGLTPNFLKFWKQYFPYLDWELGRKSNGSDDPYVVVNESIVKMLPHWQTLIDDLLKT